MAEYVVRRALIMVVTLAATEALAAPMPTSSAVTTRHPVTRRPPVNVAVSPR